MKIPTYTREQVVIFKGVGILLIVFHNFFHQLTPHIGENQFVFNPGVLTAYFGYLKDHFANILKVLFVYFGHYGVQIFIFFSAYGLTKKYFTEPGINYWSFIKSRILKIYITFLIAIALYLFFGYIKALISGQEYVQWWDSIIYKILLVSNFIPGQALKPVGPWWFMPFIFTFYLAYPFILMGYKKFDTFFLIGLAFIGFLLEAYLNPVLLSGYGINLNYLFLGYLPLISLGMYMASVKQDVSVNKWQFLVVLLVFFIGNFNEYLWILSGSCFLIMVLVLCERISLFNSNHKLLYKFLIFYGGISMHLFLVNGFLRYPFQTLAKSYNVWYLDNVLAIISVLASTVGALGFVYIDNLFRPLILKKIGS